jgi:hypothetical protein
MAGYGLAVAKSRSRFKFALRRLNRRRSTKLRLRNRYLRHKVSNLYYRLVKSTRSARLRRPRRLKPRRSKGRSKGMSKGRGGLKDAGFRRLRGKGRVKRRYFIRLRGKGRVSKGGLLRFRGNSPFLALSRRPNPTSKGVSAYVGPRLNVYALKLHSNFLSPPPGNLKPLNTLAFFVKNPLIRRLTLLSMGLKAALNLVRLSYNNLLSRLGTGGFNNSNLLPTGDFHFFLAKKINNAGMRRGFNVGLTPWYYTSIVRFIEHVSGRKTLMQFYPFMSHEVSKDDIVRYKLWLPRMAYYERRLGHRFFLEEAVHILHLGFLLRDPDIIAS